ncbi:MAG: glycosyltransferase family 2 protein, partial [Bacteroidales bacterium]
MVSIIIPVYNTFHYLEKCLHSCLQQSYQNIEIIVVNDGSTDKSADLIDSFANTHQNIRVFHQQNKGVAVARNRGIEAARGEWLFFVDSDDYISNDAIESLLSKEEDDTDIIVGDFILDYPNGRTDYIKNSLLTNSGEYEPLLSLLDEKTNFSLGGRLFASKLFEDIHTPTELKIGEDSYICI